MYGQIGIAGYTNAFAALERDSATTAGSSQLDALIALERIGTRRSYFRNDKIYAEGDAADCWYKAAFGTLHALERLPSGIVGKSAQFIPTRFISANKLGWHDKLLLAFDALVLSETLDREVALGKIIHGNHRVTVKVHTTALNGEVRKII